MEYLNQPGGSVGQVTRLEAIAAQMNIPIDTVAYLNFGDAIGTARFLYDPILQRIWMVPFGVPRETVMETMINDSLNNKYTLTSCDLLITHFHYSWQKHMAQGVWLRTKTDLVYCLEDATWYRWIGDTKRFPFITDIASPLKAGDVYSPENDKGNWEDMGQTGLGATFKGDTGDTGPKGDKGDKGDKGIDGKNGVGIASIELIPMESQAAR